MRAVAAICAMVAATAFAAQEPTYTVRQLTMETALQAARAALESCRKAGFQIAVAVVDRSGVTQIVLRDRFAGPHTIDMAVDKAWSAVTFRTSTSALAEATVAGKPMSGIRARPRVAAIGGGLMIEGAGALLGGIGVSGAPGGERDEACARAGIAAIQQSIDF
ncbi:MAG TPA: heme-binding protein [Burkholderiales bacterium]|nr:heme-binding protein [Burkholderiales bacterium]